MWILNGCTTTSELVWTYNRTLVSFFSLRLLEAHLSSHRFPTINLPIGAIRFFSLLAFHFPLVINGS